MSASDNTAWPADDATNRRLLNGVLVIGLWLITSVVTTMYTGVHGSTMLIYAFLISLTGWILGGRWLVAITTATLVLVTGLSVAELLGLYQPAPRANVLVVAAVILGSFAAISFLTGVAYRNLTQERDRALALARQMAQQNEISAQRERDLQMVLEHVPAGIASFDTDIRFRYSNALYAALLNARPEELVGRLSANFLPKEGIEARMLEWHKCLAGERRSFRRLQRDPLGGKERVLDVELVPELTHNRVTGMFATTIDVTDKVAAENRINELKESLERRVAQRTAELEAAMDKLQRAQEELAHSETRAALTTVIASVSHELSTPLGNGLLTASTLVDQCQQFQKAIDSNQLKRSDLAAFVVAVREGNGLVLRNLERAAELLKNFRQVANDSASEQRRAFDLQTMVREIADTLAPSLKRHAGRLAIDIPAGIGMDSLPAPLGQVIINLVNNAFLHAFEGRTDGLLTIHATTVEADVVLRFTDNGVGIPSNNLARLFEPFFTTKPGEGGTGLGMGIVDNLVRKTLGGTIKVQSEVGVGTCFEVRMPQIAPTTPR